MEEFIRQRMLIGESAFKILADSTVAVFGIGGVGSFCVEALVRSGIGRLILIDNDTVSVSNINRQIIALQSTVGQYKVDVSKNRCKDINPNCDIKTYKTFILGDTLTQVDLTCCDFIVDCIDTVSGKLAIIEYADKNNKKIVSCGGTGNQLTSKFFEIVDIFKTSNCPLCKVLRKECKDREIKQLPILYSKGDKILQQFTVETVGKRSTPASISFVPSVAGLMLAEYVVNNLINNKFME